MRPMRGIVLCAVAGLVGLLGCKDILKVQNPQAFTAFFHSMLSQGVHLPPSAFESWFVSASHDDAAVDRVISALPAAARAVTDSFATLGS